MNFKFNKKIKNLMSKNSNLKLIISSESKNKPDNDNIKNNKNEVKTKLYEKFLKSSANSVIKLDNDILDSSNFKN